MSASDKIALVAAIAAVISTAVSLAALYVAWLARRDSLSEQKRKVEKEKRGSQPHFNWRDGSYSGMACVAKFQNVGGEIKEISVKTETSDVGIEINPKNCIPKNGLGKIVFQKRNGPRSFPVPFTICCKTKFGEILERSFQLEEWSAVKVVEV